VPRNCLLFPSDISFANTTAPRHLCRPPVRAISAPRLYTRNNVGDANFSNPPTTTTTAIGQHAKVRYTYLSSYFPYAFLCNGRQLSTRLPYTKCHREERLFYRDRRVFFRSCDHCNDIPIVIVIYSGFLLRDLFSFYPSQCRRYRRAAAREVPKWSHLDSGGGLELASIWSCTPWDVFLLGFDKPSMILRKELDVFIWIQLAVVWMILSFIQRREFVYIFLEK